VAKRRLLTSFALQNRPLAVRPELHTLRCSDSVPKYEVPQMASRPAGLTLAHADAAVPKRGNHIRVASVQVSLPVSASTLHCTVDARAKWHGPNLKGGARPHLKGGVRHRPWIFFLLVSGTLVRSGLRLTLSSGRNPMGGGMSETAFVSRVPARPPLTISRELAFGSHESCPLL
jgi:hypothetical protein